MSIYYETNPDFTRVMEHPVVRNVRIVRRVRTLPRPL
jgi:hypothetical protein